MLDFWGILAVQILKSKFKNLNLTIIDRNLFKLDIAEKYVDNVVHLKNDKDWHKFLKNNKFNYVIEATGSPEAFKNSVNLTSNGGSIMWMGNITDKLTLNKESVSSILRKELSIIGTLEFHL